MGFLFIRQNPSLGSSGVRPLLTPSKHEQDHLWASSFSLAKVHPEFSG